MFNGQTEIYICVWNNDLESQKLLNVFFGGEGHTTCGILVPQPGIEPAPTAVKAPSPNHWTAREFPKNIHFRNDSIKNS